MTVWRVTGFFEVLQGRTTETYTGEKAPRCAYTAEVSIHVFFGQVSGGMEGAVLPDRARAGDRMLRGLSGGQLSFSLSVLSVYIFKSCLSSSSYIQRVSTVMELFS